MFRSKERPGSFGLRAGVRKRRPAGKPAWRTLMELGSVGTCQTKHGFGETPRILNCDRGMLTSASLKDIWRGHCLGTCAFLDPTMIQYNMAHAFLEYYMEAEDSTPQLLKERATARGWGL